MMKEEFEQIAGYTVTDSDYDTVIEPMYMALNISKYDFVPMISEKRFSVEYKKKALRAEMRKAAKIIKDNAEYSNCYDQWDVIKELSKQYAELLTGVQRFHEKVSPYTYTAKKYEWSCSYISKIEMVKGKNYETIETINLVA